MTEYIRAVMSAPEGRGDLLRSESSRSVSSEPSRLEDDEEYLSESETDESLRSASTGDIHSTHDGSGWASKLGSVDTNLSQAQSKLSKEQLVRHIRLKRQLEVMRKGVERKETLMEQYREQLSRCREHLSSLVDQCTSLEEEISREEQDKNTAAVALLRSQLAKVHGELSSEEAVESRLQESLERAELELSEALLAWSKFEEVQSQLHQEEGMLKEVKGKAAMQRLQTQTRMMVIAERNVKTQDRLLQSTLQAQETTTRAAIERARQAQEEGREFLKQTLNRKRREEAVEGEKHRAHLERRMKALLSLKSNIETSQGTLQAQQMLVTEKQRKQKRAEVAERERIFTEGGNPDEELLKKRRIEEFARSKELYENKQRERQLEIVSQLLEEGKMERKTERKIAKAHWHNRQQAPHASTKAMHKQKKRRRQKVDVESVVTTPKEEASAIRDKDEEEEPHSSDEEDSNIQSPHREVATISDSEESLAKPEIKGLWEKKASQKEASQGEGVSKMEREMMEEAMEKLRKSVVVKQVAAGREFKGKAFLSKPEEVVFKDFDVGKIYRKRLQLTNVSYTVNHCKLLGVSNNLKDFISIDFNPPGSMSAGLTCQMTITFEPKLTEDLTGDIQFLSQTGPFSIPVHCLTKKCLVSVDRSDMDFGKVCVGETVSREVILHNNGALPTQFQLVSCCKPARSTAIILEQRNNSIATGGQLSDQSHLSIMTAVEITNGVQGRDGDLDKVKSHSIGDLCSFSQRSITWSDQKDGTEGEEKQTGVEPEDDKERHSLEEGPPREGADQTEEGEVPSNLDAISVEGSQEILPIPDTTKASAIKIGKISEGELRAFSSRKLELVFSPKVAGSHIMEFQLSFSQLAVQPIAIRAKGEGLELPVYVEGNVVDLQICMVGRLYQDSVTIYNRAATALRITFQIPDELHPHLEVLPKYGLVQGESSFAAQLKFMPKADIFTKCHKYFKPDSGYLEVPVEIKVVNQTLPVPFTLRAQVTATDLEFSTPTIDFGACTTHESVVATLQITNKSILPQSFGFIHLPEVVDVQPNDGFGTLLPQETISLEVIFSARKPKEYSFELICKTGIDITFKIPCRGVGVLPAMELSANAINFAPTVINNITTVRVMLKNPKLGRLNSAVIRGAVLPQGPKAFEFIVPEGFPIAVSPQVGVVPLGESVGIEVQFHPRLDPKSIQEEAMRLQATLSQPPVDDLKSQKTTETEETEQQRPSSRKKPRCQSSRQSSRSEKERGSLPSSSKASFASISHSKEKIKPPKEGSDQWWMACQNLLNGFDNRCLQLSIPCFVSSEMPRSQLDTITYRPEDTLYLEVTAPIVRPGLVVVSDCGKTTIDFCDVGRGDTVTKTVTVKNISEDFLRLSSSLLDPHGPFELRNALRDIPPGGVHSLILKFSPQNGEKYYEPLKLSYGHASVLELKLVGTGVVPTVELSLEGDTLDMGHTYANDTVTHNLQLKNSSPLSVRYHIQLENLPTLKQRTGSQFRASNYNGQAVFNFVPFQGTIESGKTCEIAVSFSPDHQSPFYSDTTFITLNDQPCYTIHLQGQGWSNNLYILGGETIGPREESMAATVPLPEDQHPPPKPILVMFVCRVEEGGGKPLPVSRKLEIGCIRTPMVKKNSGDYVIEPIPNTQAHAKAFSIDPMKSSVEAGSSKTVTLTFNPSQDSSSQTAEASTNLTLKGDSVQVYRLLLRTLVCE